MSEAYRDDREAALLQLEALRRENDALRRKLEGAERPTTTTTTGPGADGVSPSLLAAMLVSMFFLAGAVVYTSAVAGIRRTRIACARYGHAAAVAEARAAEASAPGEIRVVSDVPAGVQIEGRVVGTAHGSNDYRSGPLPSGRSYHVMVWSLRDTFGGRRDAFTSEVTVRPGGVHTIHVVEGWR